MSVMTKKILAFTFAMALVPAAAYACPGMEHEAKPKDEKPAVETASASLRIEGLENGSALKVKTALKKLAGVIKVSVVVKDKRAIVRFDPKQVNTAKLIKAVKDLGLKVSAEGTTQA